MTTAFSERIWIDQLTEHVDTSVLVCGFVRSLRVMGDKLVFVDLRDGSGTIQTVFYKPSLSPEAMETIDALKPESSLAVRGTVQKRGPKQVNPDQALGYIELAATDLTLFTVAQTPPFEVDKDTIGVSEEVRLKHRYLDLRTDRLQHHLRLRSEFLRRCREFLHAERFVEIETPMLSQATPEGSRDFLVPSRLQPGKAFALPQSPQQYKQLLMVGGLERYYQMARCMRDEDPRADRGFEFTQIDLEMSYVNREMVMDTIERMVIAAVEPLGYVIKQKPFPRITFAESMAKYGADKFDMRTEEEKQQGNVLAYAWVVDFPFFEKDEKTGRWTFTHNPFSAPLPEHLEQHLSHTNIEQILTTQYDLVCNGYEAGGGSIRAHDPRVLRATYEIMGYANDEIERSVGHILEAFKYGAPPHGGIALGVERNLMNLTGESTVREVQAFPMTSSGQTSVMQAPSPMDTQTLNDLHLKTVPS